MITESSLPGKIKELCKKRDELIKELWITFNSICNLQKNDDFTSEDVDLWAMATRHSAIIKWKTEIVKDDWRNIDDGVDLDKEGEFF